MIEQKYSIEIFRPDNIKMDIGVSQYAIDKATGITEKQEIEYLEYIKKICEKELRIIKQEKECNAKI